MSTKSSVPVRRFDSCPTGFRMPALLRLDSVGESSPSSPTEFYDKEVLPILKSGAHYPASYCTQSTPSRVNQSTNFSKWSPSKMPPASKMFSPSHHSTPNFMKSHSFPESMHPTTMSNAYYTYSDSLRGNMNGVGSKQSHFNNSLPLPQQAHEMSETKRLGTSLSTPSLWAQCSGSEVKPYASLTADVMKFQSPGVMGPLATASPDSCDSLKSGEKVDVLSQPTCLVPPFQPSVSSTPVALSANHSRITSDRLKSEDSPCQEDISNHSSSSVDNCDDASASTDMSLNCEEKLSADRSFVLFRERKCTKKGRPSAKKQKKRKREKQKQSSDSENCSEHSLIFSLTLNDGSDDSEIHKKRLHVSVSNDSISFVEGQSEEVSKSDFIAFPSSSEVTSVSPSIVPKSPPTTSNQSSLACLLISRADSEDEDTDEDSADDSWSSDDMDDPSASLCASQLGFGILTLDAIFKQKDVPSLRSVMQEAAGETVGSPNSFKVYVGSPISSSLEDSVQFSDSLPVPSSPLAQSVLNSFSQGLCLDSLLSHVVTVTPYSASAADGQSQETDPPVNPELQEINARWNQYYQASGFRCCSSPNPVICHPSVKVCFAEESELTTVHEIGNEDRKGIWQNYALDRERFGRRIHEVNQVVGPILDSAHREKVLARNLSLSHQENVTQAEVL